MRHTLNSEAGVQSIFLGMEILNRFESEVRAIIYLRIVFFQESLVLFACSGRRRGRNRMSPVPAKTVATRVTVG